MWKRGKKPSADAKGNGPESRYISRNGLDSCWRGLSKGAQEVRHSRLNNLLSSDAALDTQVLIKSYVSPDYRSVSMPPMCPLFQKKWYREPGSSVG